MPDTSILERSLNKTAIYFVLLAMLIQMSNIFGYMGFGPDNIMQAITAKALIEGQNLSIPFADPSDLSKTVYEAYGMFPPGFALLLTPLLLLSNYDLIMTIHIAHVLAMLLFFFIWYKIFRLLDCNLYATAIPMLFGFWAIAYSPFRMIGATDLFSLTFFSISLFFALKLLLKQPKNQYKYILLIALCSFLCSFFRFAYYTQIFVIPGLIVLVAIFRKSRKELIAGFFAILCTGVLVSLQMVHQKLSFQSVNLLADHLDGNNRWFYLENLKTFNPVITNGFIPENIVIRNFVVCLVKRFNKAGQIVLVPSAL